MTALRLLPLALLTGGVALAGAALAEGARSLLRCTAADGTAATFTIAPTEVDADGAGRVTVRYAGNEAATGYAASHLGPFIWSTATDRFTLLIDGQTGDGRLRVLFHRLLMATSPVSGHLTSLTCEADL